MYRVVSIESNKKKTKTYDLEVSYFWIPIWFDAGYVHFDSLEDAENEIEYIRTKIEIKRKFYVEDKYVC